MPKRGVTVYYESKTRTRSVAKCLLSISFFCLDEILIKHQDEIKLSCSLKLTLSQKIWHVLSWRENHK